jgi:hypothetical protein
MNQISSSVYEVKQKSLAVKNQGNIKRAACLLPYVESELKNVLCGRPKRRESMFIDMNDACSPQ